METVMKLSNNTVVANAINGIEIDLGTIDFSLWGWGGASFLIGFIITFVLLAIIRENQGWILVASLFFMIGVLVSLLAYAVIESLINQPRMSSGVDEISEHYNVSLATDDEEKVSGRDIFGEDATKFTSVVIEHDYSKTEGSVLRLDNDRWALVVEEGAESSGDFVEFDDFIAEEGSGEDVEEVESSSS